LFVFLLKRLELPYGGVMDFAAAGIGLLIGAPLAARMRIPEKLKDRTLIWGLLLGLALSAFQNVVYYRMMAVHHLDRWPVSPRFAVLALAEMMAFGLIGGLVLPLVFRTLGWRRRP
jgi:H+/Cl- antiporter ClcA